MSEKTGLLEQSPGVTSSKRVIGVTLVAAGGLLLVAAGVVAFFRLISDPSTVLSAGTTLLSLGAGLLGLTVVDNASETFARRFRPSNIPPVEEAGR